MSDAGATEQPSMQITSSVGVFRVGARMNMLRIMQIVGEEAILHIRRTKCISSA